MSGEENDNPYDAAMLGGGQTSTSKALLIFIHVPKILRVHIAKDETNSARRPRAGTIDETTKTRSRAGTVDDPDLTTKASMEAEETKSIVPKPELIKKNPSTASRGHRKTGSFASLRNEVPMMPMDTVTTSTSTLPTANNTPKTSDERLETVDDDDGEILEESMRDTSEMLPPKPELPVGEHEIGYVEAEETKKGHQKNVKSVIEHVITAEEMAAVVNLELGDMTGQVWDAPFAGGNPLKANPLKAEPPVPGPTSPAENFSSAVKNFFGIVTNKEDGVSQLDREETIQIIKAQKSKSMLPVFQEEENKGPAPNTEIRVHALLQLTCRNLYKEGCFFTMPAQIDIKKGWNLDDWVQFTIMCKPNSIDTVLERLERIGVGSSVGMISIYKSELLKTADWATEQLKKKDEKAVRRGSLQSKEDRSVLVEEAKQEWKNAASRMRIEQIKEQIHEQAALSFDFLALLLIASILAGVGLITNSTVVIVASMLVSPIMGPVMGITFGSRVLDWKLARDSAFNEVAALLICVLTGAAVGFASAFSEYADDWPNSEMASRGTSSGLVTGIAIAIPSGMGVALSILGNNTASLVGVAISASLLPPAVNAGICWAHAILIQSGAVENTSGESFVVIGAISFALTLVNIVCIWIFGIIMFTIKEVTPSVKKSAFWARDIKVARATQKTGTLKSTVDIEKIRAGLQEALEQKRNEEAGNLAKAKLNMARKFRRRHKPRDFSFCLIDDAVEEDDEDYLDFFMMGLNPLVEEAEGLDPKDRAAYLGFRASMDDFAVSEDPIPESTGGKPAWMSFFNNR